MTTQEITARLKAEAAKDPIFAEICTMFALRQRARYELTISGLRQRMDALGSSIDPVEYPARLRFLASLGFGTLVTDSKGRVKGLKGLTVTLQSIGRAAVGAQPVALQSYRRRHRYGTLPTVKAANARVVEKVWKTPQTPASVTIGVVLGGKLVSITVPKDTSASEIANILNRLRDQTA